MSIQLLPRKPGVQFKWGGPMCDTARNPRGFLLIWMLAMLIPASVHAARHEHAEMDNKSTRAAMQADWVRGSKARQAQFARDIERVLSVCKLSDFPDPASLRPPSRWARFVALISRDLPAEHALYNKTYMCLRDIRHNFKTPRGMIEYSLTEGASKHQMELVAVALEERKRFGDLLAQYERRLFPTGEDVSHYVVRLFGSDEQASH